MRERIIVGQLICLVVLVALVGACGSGATPTPSASPSIGTGHTFLDDYVTADGQVVRYGQGGDTVSEGQAYALLLDVAVGDRAQFSRVLEWSNAHLRQPDGLFAYHWQGGKVVDVNPATDADLDVVRALLVAGSLWHDTVWTNQGLAYARAILANETVTIGASVFLVAGPWARTEPYYVDPSYYDPATFEMIAARSGDPRWNLVEASSMEVIAADTNSGQQLPSDWAQVSSSGHIQPSSPPTGGATVYGYDAFRTLVRQVDDCSDGQGKAIVSHLLPLAAKTVATNNQADTYNLDATPSQGGANPLMLVAAARSGIAAGQPVAARRYLAEADAAAARQPSYYLDAWVALGQSLLTTTTLTACPA